MRLTASVRRATGSTIHTLGTGTPGDITLLQSATRLEIVDSTEGVMLLRYSSEGAFVGDTWHITIEEAKRQAQFEFDVDPSEWTPSE